MREEKRGRDRREREREGFVYDTWKERREEQMREEKKERNTREIERLCKIQRRKERKKKRWEDEIK